MSNNVDMPEPGIDTTNHAHVRVIGYTADQLRAAVLAEREACAAACELIEDEYQRSEGHRYPELKSDAQTGAGDCAAAIRARGEKC